MSKNTVFRKITKKEKQEILSFLSKNFGDSSLEPFTSLEMWIKEGKIKEVFALNQEVSRLVETLSYPVDFSGTPIGSYENGSFVLEIEGAKLVLPFTDRILKIKTEQFLYGKPIFMSNITSIPEDCEKQDWIIVIGEDSLKHENHLHYGIGKTEISYKEYIKEVNRNTIVIRGNKNKPFDRGWYLRKGK